ncbi:50S ribosomal protein L28 [Rubrobacter indicoceani]|uniref:50S ribosomal protein L28 n=1 Tax=Rubrobacter indicoceani TaxID=2051957 RepID=UPI000E5B0048|nr:50S ribosomal protein L28 [Rubrobacter indicoceani]
MSRKCALTGKRPDFGNAVSHSQRKTRRVRNVNIQRRRVWVEDEKRWVRMNLSARVMKTLVKKGLRRFLKDEGLRLKDVI